MIEIQLSSALVIKGLGSYLQDVQDFCSITVPAAQGQPAYQIPMWQMSLNGEMEVPRGFLAVLREVFHANNVPFQIENYKRNCEVDYSDVKTVVLREHQEEPIRQILRNQDGIIVAPPGSGKTVMVLEAIRRSKQKALIIVDKKQLVDQWAERCQEFLGIKVNDPDDTRIQVQTVQSLMRANRAWGSRNAFGFVCLDECHHISAKTYGDVLTTYNPTFRIGVSATPKRSDGLEKLAAASIGPIIHVVTDEQLREASFLVKPTIIKVPTDFRYVYWGDHFAKENQECQVPGCKKFPRAHGHRNNYAKVISALAEDKDRNARIARTVMVNVNGANLIVSDRLGHLEALRNACIEAGFDPARVHMLTGREKSEERAIVTRQAGYGACVILSTIAKEALDIPRLDRLHLAWPVKKPHLLEQTIGRVTRAHPDKSDALVYDYQDSAPVLANQARQRNNYYYNKKLDVKELLA